MSDKTGRIFYLQPVGNIGGQILELVGRILTEAFGGETRLLPKMEIKPHFPKTGNYNAYQFAMAIHSQLRPGDDGITRGIILGIAESGRFYSEDFTARRYNGPLDGYAAKNGIVAIITLATYHHYRDDEHREDLAKRELRNLVLHELGHIFGADHCDENCLMRSNTSPLARFITPKNEPVEYCRSCALRIRHNLRERTRDAKK